MKCEKRIQDISKTESYAPRSSSRRRALKTIAGGVSALTAYHVLPSTWSEPIIEQIFLPAHAAVSGITLNDPCIVELVSGNQSSSIDAVRISGFVSPPVVGREVTIVATPNGGSSGPLTVITSTVSDGTYSAEITMTGGPGIIGVGVTATVSGGIGAAHCSAGSPPADHPSAELQAQQPVSLSLTGQTALCGGNLNLDPAGALYQSWQARLSPSPNANQTVAAQYFINGNPVGPPFEVIVFTSGLTEIFNINLFGPFNSGDNLRCRVTYAAAGVEAECSNTLVAAAYQGYVTFASGQVSGFCLSLLGNSASALLLNSGGISGTGSVSGGVTIPTSQGDYVITFTSVSYTQVEIYVERRLGGAAQDNGSGSIGSVAGTCS